MEVFVIFQAVFVLSGMIVNTEAELSLTVISPLGESKVNDLNKPEDFECNAEATLVCEVKPYIDSVIWQINGQTYAVCIFQNCFTYPPFPENHNFTMDIANEVFSLTMNPVTNSTNNNIYKCDDGITARSVDATVKVYTTNETLKMDTTAEDRITVTTGCVYPNGIENVTFEWYISKDNTTLDSVPFTSKENKTVIFDCTETPSCTVEETSHFNNTVVFDGSDDGEEYYIYVVIKHNDAPDRPPTIRSTGRRYKIKTNDIDVKDCHIYIFFIICLAVRFLLIQTLLSGYSLYKTFPKDGLTHLTDKYKWMGFLASLPVVGLILPIETVYRELKKGVSYKIIGRNVALTLIHPVVFVCFTTNKAIVSKSCIFILFLAMGCIIVMGAEAAILSVGIEFCLEEEIYYVPLMFLYLVLAWLYLTPAMIYIKKTTEQNNKTEQGKYVCSKCGENLRYKCQICKELMCDKCRRYHKKHSKEISPRDEEKKLLCESCCKMAINSYCMTCEEYLCVRCMKSHERCGQGLLRHQQHNEVREKEFCCDSCKNAGYHVSAAHAFCLTCSTYLCTSCLKAKHKTCTLLWIQEQSVEIGQGLCCEGIEDHRELPLEGVCLTCESYICTRCLKSPTEHGTHLVSSHQQEHSTTGRRLHMCCDINYRNEVQKTINYCIDCNCYLCGGCFTTHRQHRLFCNKSIDSLEPTSEIWCKGCEKYNRLPVECYNLHNDEFLCAKCFERGHKSFPWKRTQYKNADTHLFKDWLRNHQPACQIHSVLGESSSSHVEVYCLVCKIHMCRVCFFWHRRIAEYWIKTQKGNLFYCSICKKDKHVYPVECCNLTTGEYLCANCYESDKHYSKTKKYAAGQNKDVRQITLNLKNGARPCQIHMFPFHEQEKEILGSVYCLVCKLYLCKHCFKLHRRLKDVWQQQQMHGPQDPFQVDSSTDHFNNDDIETFANHPDRSSWYQVSTTNIGLIVLWHFPLAGIIIAAIHWFCKLKRDERKVNPAI